jgi:hypothetical protein
MVFFFNINFYLIHFVYVILKATRLRLQVEKVAPPLLKDDGRVIESCSCVYGNPCVDE